MKNNKLLLVFLLALLVSCTKKSKIEDVFITPKDYYWQWSSTCYDYGCSGINYQFEEGGYSHRYDFSIKEGYTLNEGEGGDLIILPEKWFIKNDSTLVWGRSTYKIDHIDRTVIVLSYFSTKNKKEKCSIRLLKVVGEK
jgi:hypothetical protein